MYVAVTKNVVSSGRYESYQILDGATVLLEKSRFSGKGVDLNEACLNATTNNQYSLKLAITRNDPWNNGAWVSVAGIYGNIVLKTTQIAEGEEYTLSLYYPVMKNEEWKMLVAASTIDSNWNTASFDDSAWTAATLGSVTTTATGSQYFRKSFAGIPDMAAYEVELNYRYGIVVYVNGVEVFRDHMADGAVTPATVSTDAYDAYEYHGVIRPAGEIEGSNNVLAVELHFPDLTVENAVEFDVYVASIAPSTPITEDTQCFVYPYGVTLTATGGMDRESIFNWSFQDRLLAYSSHFPLTVTYDLTGPLAHINGVRVWSYTFITQSPGSFTLSGAASSSSAYTDVVSVSGASYEANEFRTFYGYFNAKPYQSYGLTITGAVSGGTLMAAEVQPVTCHDLVPTGISFYPTSYYAYVNYDTVTICPQSQEFTNCAVTPSLPAGLTLDATTCVISGIPTAASPQTTYTMTSEMDGQSYHGTFTLETPACAGTMVSVSRTYMNQAERESFSIKDVETQEVVLDVPPYSTQVNSQTVTTVLCLTGTRYQIDVYASGPWWPTGSNLYVRALLSKDESELITRIRYDRYQGLPTSYIINTQWGVAPRSQWFYKMGEVPANWYGAETAGWESGAIGSFPASTNSIQLYKKTFDVASLSNVSGFVISLRYQYGCVIYLNGVEVFRNGVTDDLTADSTSSNAYTKLIYHQISLPAKTVATDATPAVNYLVEGSNTIAIAIVAQTASQTDSVFDCAMRYMDALESRMFNLEANYNGITGNPHEIEYQGYSYTMGSTACEDNYYQVTFRDDRREWISSVILYLEFQQEDRQPRQFVLQARNANSEEWTVIKSVTNMAWSKRGEHKRIWLENSKSWNQYRFANFGTGDPDSCAWMVSALGMLVDAVPTTIPDLSYPTPLSFLRDMKIEDVYPSSDYYFDFTVSPALPAGVALDPHTGIISGRPSGVASEAVYTVTAKKYGGGNSMTTITVSVDACFGERNMISLTVYPGSFPSEGSYKLYSGRGTDGDVVASMDTFTVADGLERVEWCLPHDIYTVGLYDSKNYGWGPGGYYLTVDRDEMIFEMGLMNRQMGSDTMVFSSVLPFQVGYGNWKVWNKEEAVSEHWKSASFDEMAWETKKTTEFGTHASTTAYIRHEVSIPAIEDYHVLNVRMKYSGGVVVYFNGVKVARFNLEESYNANTEAIAAHDATTFSKFHVILPNVNAVTGTNVIAFEIHRAAGESAVVFDATGVFGVSDCSPLVDSYSSVESGVLESSTKNNLLDYNTTSYICYNANVESFLSWGVENLEGSRFNSFGFHTSRDDVFTYSIIGRWKSEEQYTNALLVSRERTQTKLRSAWSMPVGHAGFNQFKLTVDQSNTVYMMVYAYVMQYCVPSGTGMCAADGEYPAVNNGEKAVVKGCPEGMYGYHYRVCTDGVLGEEQQECKCYAPTDLAYAQSSYSVGLGEIFSSGDPTFTGIISLFEVINGTLPEGLMLNETTGAISGSPSDYACVSGCSVTIQGANADAATTVVVSFQVLPPIFSYPVAGAGVHIALGEDASVFPSISADASSYTSFEATGLPEGLSIDATTGEILGTATGSARSVEVTVKGIVDETLSRSISFTLFLHDHSAAQPFVPAGASCSYSLRLYAREAVESTAVYLDEGSSTASLGLTGVTLEAGEMTSTYVCLTDSEYAVHSNGLDIVVLKGANPVAAFLGVRLVDDAFSTTLKCEESLDVECNVVAGREVLVKESGAASGTTYAEGEIIALDRSKIYEM